MKDLQRVDGNQLVSNDKEFVGHEALVAILP